MLTFGTATAPFKTDMIPKHIYIYVEMDAVLVIKISMNLSPIYFVSYQEKLAVTYQWLEWLQFPKEKFGF